MPEKKADISKARRITVIELIDRQSVVKAQNYLFF